MSHFQELSAISLQFHCNLQCNLQNMYFFLIGNSKYTLTSYSRNSFVEPRMPKIFSYRWITSAVGRLIIICSGARPTSRNIVVALNHDSRQVKFHCNFPPAMYQGDCRGEISLQLAICNLHSVKLQSAPFWPETCSAGAH